MLFANSFARSLRRAESSRTQRVTAVKVKVILTSKEGSHCLPRHWQIERDCVTLLHAERLEDVRERTDLAEELGVSHGAALSGLVCFPDNGCL
jgi:hypothetical protein